MREISVKIPSEVSNEVERLFFEYRASLDIIAYLMSRDEVKDTHLQKYLDSSELKYTALELSKAKYTELYKPAEFASRTPGYEFNFEDEIIIYRVND